MSSPYVLEVMPDQQLAGREIVLSKGSRVQIFPANSEGSYVIRCILPVGAEMTMGLSNEAAAALLVALMKEFDEGKLQAGFELLDTQRKDKNGGACPHCGASPLIVVTRGGLMGIRTPYVPVCQTCGGKLEDV